MSSTPKVSRSKMRSEPEHGWLGPPSYPVATRRESRGTGTLVTKADDKSEKMKFPPAFLCWTPTTSKAGTRRFSRLPGRWGSWDELPEDARELFGQPVKVYDGSFDESLIFVPETAVALRAVSQVAGARKTARPSRDGGQPLRRTKRRASFRLQAGQGKKSWIQDPSRCFQLLPVTFLETCPCSTGHISHSCNFRIQRSSTTSGRHVDHPLNTV
jgi:hypothetical protein